jgi:hypothetical protein
VPDTIHCETHGDSEQAFICIHLTGESSGLGFNRDDPSEDHPFPDAWCDNCEIIREAHDGWDDVPTGLCKIVAICAECYERSRIRNVRPSVTLDTLAGLRWKCSNCEEWHTGPILDLSFDEPAYWPKKMDIGSRWKVLPSGEIDKSCQSFLDQDYCAIEGREFYVRGLIHLPIIGAAETFCGGVWGSLSRENFEKLLRMDALQVRTEGPPMFSWLSSNIGEYPNTLNLKMYVHIQEAGMRPHFRLELDEHLLSQEYHRGIAPERVKEIMFHSLPQPE